jgi:antirestriction protein
METQIYIADLAAYNAGFLRGKWIDANQTLEELNNEVYNLLLESPESNIPCTVCNNCGHIEHYATVSVLHGRLLSDINGWDNPAKQTCPGCDSDNLRQTVTAEEFAIHDTNGIDVGEYTSLQVVSELAEQLAEHGDAWTAYVSNRGQEYATQSDFEDCYQGEHDSEESFAENYADGCGMDTSKYFDWKQFTYELFMDYAFVDGHVFSS